jgi:hypothetical protein
MEDTAEVFADDAASLLTSATQRSIAHKKKFHEEFTWLKAEHQVEMEARQKAQHEVQEVQDQQEAQLATSLKTMQDLQWQMSALQAKQQPSASSGAADAPREE